ncbi:hypothetical protein [Saccharothrix texasensis]|uniref:hypothetical protein n=1 Tax=Saccharothrix texasensis TaxID=103734 RepID=UPI001FE30440|nr:hypothetical protein [Saccharothrix texasensis]
MSRSRSRAGPSWPWSYRPAWGSSNGLTPSTSRNASADSDDLRCRVASPAWCRNSSRIRMGPADVATSRLCQKSCTAAVTALLLFMFWPQCTQIPHDSSG